jgi:ABC-type antimicrobial peptide transport system permease subunit
VGFFINSYAAHRPLLGAERMLAPMFYLSYLFSELRRRKGRTLLTALGLGVGVGLVVTVSALTTGLDRAQDKVLEPLTGVGTDMSVTRPLKIDSQGQGPGGLSEKERNQLQQENGRTRFDLNSQAKPGAKFTRTDFMSAAQLSFPASQISKLAALDGVEDAAGSLTLSAVSISGTVPENGFQRPTPGTQPQPQRAPFDVKSLSVTGFDETKPALAAIGAGQITSGRTLRSGSAREAVLNVSYARRNGIKVGETIKLKDKTFTVVGLARSPLGGQASDAYVKLGQLQAISDRKGRVNAAQVRAKSTGDVAAVEKRINATLSGASVTTASDLADRVGGSLADAKSLSGKLGTALTIVGLAAAFLIASLLTLSSVTKRIRELGTLKAIGWPGRHVVRQVTGESVAQGALGGIFGALIGIGGAALVSALAPALEATVAAPAAAAGGPIAGGPGGPRGAFGLGQAAITSGTEKVSLEAPVDLGLILLAIGLALLGGLIAGSVGGLRASRLRPADALRHID